MIRTGHVREPTAGEDSGGPAVGAAGGSAYTGP